MTTQPTLFEVGRAQLPPRVLAFASGSNEARELRGFALAGVPAGISVELVREEAVGELLRSKLPIFADSGAFSEVTMTPEGPRVDHPISHRSWLKRLALYQRLALVHGEQLFVVAPDRVADQQHTLILLERYRPQLHQLAATGAHVLIPVQRGRLSAAEFYRHAVAVVGIPLVSALPMKKAGMSHADVLQFAQELRPARLHLLGMGYQTSGAKRLVRALLALDDTLQLSLDSNRLRAVTGQSRPLTVTERELRTQPVEELFAEAEHEALRVAGERLDYTDAIAMPGSWASEAVLQAIAFEAFVTALNGISFLPIQTDTCSSIAMVPPSGNAPWSHSPWTAPGQRGSRAGCTVPCAQRLSRWSSRRVSSRADQSVYRFRTLFPFWAFQEAR